VHPTAGQGTLTDRFRVRPVRCSCLGRLPRLVARGYPAAVSGPV